MNQAKYYGVSQSFHGHEYRWVFTEEEIISQIGEDVWSDITQGEDYYGLPKESPYLEDVGFPIGGSNSSATLIETLSNDDEIKVFLTRPADGPDIDDPMLVDIAEYLLTVDVDCGACTQEFLDKFGFTMKDLEQLDDCYQHKSESERMIAELLSSTDAYENGIDGVIDRDNPFYGFSSDMRYSELCDIYEEYLQKKTEEIEELEG